MSYNTKQELKIREEQCKGWNLKFIPENYYKCIDHNMNFMSEEAYNYHLKIIHEND